MNAQNTQQLLADFPRLFRSAKISDEHASPLVIECGDGWYGLIRQLATDIEQTATAAGRDEQAWPQVLQVKEKFGRLRFYVLRGDDAIYALIGAAEGASDGICETCGAPGQLRSGSWLKVRCDQCHATFAASVVGEPA